MSALHVLAEAVGLAREWRDARGCEQVVADTALATILGALGYPAESDAEARASLARLQEEAGQPPAFLSADVNKPEALPSPLAHATTAELQLEDGSTRQLTVQDGMLPGISEFGYHTLRIAGHTLVLAVAPPRCLLPSDLAGAKRSRLWGTAIQIPSLHEKPAAYGDFDDLRGAVRLFADRGADAVAISPVHAPNPANNRSFSPYSPSSRLFLNPVLAELNESSEDGGSLIDWSASLPQRYQGLRRTFAALDADARAQVNKWAQAQGAALQRHALYNALSLHFSENGAGWQAWPQEYQDPDGPAAARFAAERTDEVEFHFFTQWLAGRSLAAAQREATKAGAAIGLISDLAVGIDPGGSDAWALQGAMLQGLTVGAPPDLLGPEGQNWGLTNFSPRGLARSAFAPWISTVRAALRHAGGVRIDHAFGLARLWIVPGGAAASEGAYLRYPFTDMLRLLAIESHRAGAIIVGEDLGTRPSGFIEPFSEKGILGMRVLWFERDHAGGFCRQEDFPVQAIAMSGTHDLATVAGWWRGRDIEWNRRLGRGASAQEEGVKEEERQRMADRKALWDAVGKGAPQPAQDDPAPVVDAAVEHLGKTPSALAIIPLEDLLGLEEQPNLPGTIDEHPNWRRRLSAPLADLLAEPVTARRIAALVEARSA
ncbi:4-alpha-glucanotransferase [Novosphingobium sp. RD2P27]|uniref:4-alpha-glucanotransferase n=1 Tax=Novosphingobium kalidii TaxID=3230299 RepID=A0ABV2CZI1_9SPHN